MTLRLDLFDGDELGPQGVFVLPLFKSIFGLEYPVSILYNNSYILRMDL